MASIYANVVNVRTTLTEFVLEFGYGEKAQDGTVTTHWNADRVVMPVQALEHFISCLLRAREAYSRSQQLTTE